MAKSQQNEELVDQWTKALSLPSEQKKALFDETIIDAFNIYMMKLETEEGIPANKLLNDFLNESGNVVARHLKMYIEVRKDGMD